MAIFQDLLLSTLDKGTKKPDKLRALKVDSKIKDWQLLLTNKTKVEISSLIKNGPLLLIFIRGTWCPFCRMHMGNLRNWVNKLQGKNATIIVVSSEPVDAIKSWLDKNPFPYLFASDENFELSDYFGVRVIPDDFSQAATFVIDSDLSVRLAYTGKRGNKNFLQVQNALD